MKSLSIDDFVEGNLKNPMSGFVLFYAEWCGHCKRLLPIWEKLSGKQEGQSFPTAYLSFNCSDGSDENVKTISETFEVKGYPTIYWFKDGKNMGKYTGGRSEDDFKKFAKDNELGNTDLVSSVSREKKNYMFHIFFILLILILFALLIFNICKKDL